MAECKECLHYKVCLVHCSESVLKNRGVCEHFYEEPAHGKWIKPTVIGGRSFDIPHCSLCEGVPCGVNEHTKFCPECGHRMDGGE